MKKKKLFLIGGSMILFGMVVCLSTWSMGSITSDLLISNLEALATTEDNHDIECVPEDNSMCIKGSVIRTDNYYSPH